MQDPFVVDRPLLRDVCLEFAVALVRECENSNLRLLAVELLRVAVPPQQLAGSPEAYSFLAYPVPRLSREERELLQVRENFERIRLRIRGGEVALELDCFGRIGWFFVTGLPQFFEPLQEGLRSHAL